MILDAVLLALTEIASAEQRSIAILPDMRLASGDEVSIKNSTSGYELWLSGSIDYVVQVIEYDNEIDNKGQSDHDPN